MYKCLETHTSGDTFDNTKWQSLTGEKVDYIESYDFNNSNPTTIELFDNDRDTFDKRLRECENTIRRNNYKKIYEIDKSRTHEFCKNIRCEFYDSCYSKS